VSSSPGSDSRFDRLEPTEIAAGDLQLRPWSMDLADAVLAAAADPEITRWNTVRLPHLAPGQSLTDRAQAAEWISSRLTWERHASWAVCDSVSGEVLGYASLHDLTQVHSSGETGYWVLPGARGRGVGRRILSAVAGFGFGALDLVRIDLYHAVENPASCAVAVASGFVLEGVTRQSYRYGDGLLHDEHLHARLTTDPALR
jgi:RimJ/RimL family protein N-acetyltransferase